MSSDPGIPAKNRLIAALSREEYERLLPNLETVSLPLKYVLYEPNEPIEHVYFPIHGVVSLVAIMEDGVAVETATVGNEGMIGLPVFLGADTIPMKALSQIPGKGIRMKADAFKDLVKQGSPLHGLLYRYTRSLFNQMAQSAACNRLHPIEQRCCRWLLMAHDRMDSDEYLLTQEFLSQMLGVHRASVNVVAGILQNAGLICYSRGRITILDRLALEAAACECYARIKQEFDRLFADI